MDEMKEESLDRHFTSQLRMMAVVYEQTMNNTDSEIIQRWLEMFRDAPKQEKYARNCLMLLMYGQLSEMGKLIEPFTVMENMQRNLEEVLNEYQGTIEDEVQQEPEQTKPKQTEPEPLSNEDVVSHADSNDDVVSHADTNASSYGGGSSRLFDLSHKLLSPSFERQTSSFERVSAKNQKLIKEIEVLTARSVENEKLLRKTDSSWQKMMTQCQMPLPLQRDEALCLRVDRNTQQAIRRLKDWKASSGPLKFLRTIFQDILLDEPKTHCQLSKLDGKLESVLDNMLEQAGERCEQNMRMMYDQLFKQQQETLKEQQQLLRNEQQALVHARRAFDAHVNEIKQREEFPWERELNAGLQRQQRHSRQSAGAVHRRSQPNSYPASNCSCSQCQTDWEQLSSSSFAMSVPQLESESIKGCTCPQCQTQCPEPLEEFLKQTDDEFSTDVSPIH